MVPGGEPFVTQLQLDQEAGRASSPRMMSLVTLVPQAHINTSLTEADNVEAMDKSEWTIWGLQKITQCVQSIRGG